MSVHTDSVSKPGRKKNAGTDDRELFMRHFGESVLEAYEETHDFKGLTYVKTVSSGKAWAFPIIGRKRDATDHIPGSEVLGGGVEHNEIDISVDDITVDAAFIAEIDELLNHYSLADPYARQLGESLSSVSNGRIARAFVNASRVTEAPYEGGPLPSYYFHANVATDPAKLEEAGYAAAQHMRENDIGGGTPFWKLPWQQYFLLARYTGIDTVDTSGSGNRAAGTVGTIAGLQPAGSNFVPRTNYTADKFAKYNGNFSTTVGIIGNRMAVGTLKRRAMKVIMKEQDTRLGTLLMASQLEGHGSLRPECAFEIRTDER